VLPFAVMIMVAASASFATPIGYQTNLMVYGPGDYQFSDFLKLGVPLTIIVGVVSYFLIPIIWPL
jgi:di/tricarboxylate transporter